MSQPDRICTPLVAMSEYLVQRKLFIFGALLAWMILFHILVNVWLLCVFTSLLIVTGGWLGFQAVIDLESVIHLDRFITLEEIRPSANSETQLDNEIRDTVGKIIRDFVSSWYNIVSSEHKFEDDLRNSMIEMGMELKRRAKKVDRKALTMKTLDLCGCHLQCYLKAKEIMVEKESQKESASADTSLWQAYSVSCSPHPALQSSAEEVNYARAIVDLLLHVLVPPPHLETRTGRFVVCELITCNVLLPLIAKLSDPDWLNMLIVNVFTKSAKPESRPTEPVNLPSPPVAVSAEEQSHQHFEVPSSLTLKDKLETPSVTDALPPELTSNDVPESADLYCLQNQEDEEPNQIRPFSSVHPDFNSTDYPRLAKSNPFYQETDSDLESPQNDFKRSSLESLVLIATEEATSDRTIECPTLVDEEPDPEDELPLCSNAPKVVVSEIQEEPSDILDEPDELLSSFCTLQDLEKGTSKAEMGTTGVEQFGVVNSNELTLTEPLQASSPSGGAMPLSPFAFEPLSSPEGPVIIQNLRITGTITAKEHRGTGSHPYTLYTVKYETSVDSENPGTIQPVAYHMVNRRYSEFLNLQTRLEEKTELRKILKHIKGPKKIFPDLPFGNMDSDRVEARKSLLETFLKQLCAIPETANSEEMQEFLALNTDARIAFVKKPFIVSRIDKIVVNAIVDTLKTAFPRSEPQSPTDEVDPEPEGKLSSDKKAKSRMRFSSKIAPALSVSDMKPKVIYCFDDNSTVFNGLTFDGLESFIMEQERLPSKVRDGDGEHDVNPGPRFDTESCTCARGKLPNIIQNQGGTVVADMALNILCLLMKDQWSWLCTENVQKSIRMVFGTLIERWLEVGVANLMCTQYWVTYLRVIQEAVWPGGNLPAQPRPLRTQQQRDDTKQQSLQCLMKLLPDLVTDLLGSEKYKLSWQIVLDSFQDSTINRHLVYCVWDLLIEFLVPELSEDDFQKTLLHSLSKNAEKLPP
ncbi:sorting nexin-19 isoform X2 [Trichomycterus rosablanca]|uniref:sorting nexin-19 isoform X2 n=1 Tax=Trichomycterus rosablanca TaxID=2290929 RepID=UPI002F356600